MSKPKQKFWHISILIFALVAFLSGLFTRGAIDSFVAKPSVEQLETLRLGDLPAWYDPKDLADSITVGHKNSPVMLRQMLSTLLLARSADFSIAVVPLPTAIPDELFINSASIGVEVKSIDCPPSKAALLLPRDGAHNLVVFHGGHGEVSIDEIYLVQHLLGDGNAVLFVSLPLSGLNDEPTLRHPLFGNYKLFLHNQFLIDDSERLHCFFAPIKRLLDFSTERMNVSDVSLIGFSGGGWVASFYAAVDPRVKASISVAGSLPYTLLNERDWRALDYEQLNPSLVNSVALLDVYILAALGDGRSHTLVFNEFDSCCFAGRRGLDLVPLVRNSLSVLGKGTFDVMIDEGQIEHSISRKASGWIVDRIRE